MYYPRNLDELQSSLEDIEELDRSHPQVSHLILIAHGVRDSPLTWSRSLADLLKSKHGDTTAVYPVNWNPYSDDVFRCAVSAKRIGHKIGRIIASLDQIESLHLIGHSCGAFVVYGICREVKSDAPRITIQSTYLDPLSIYGAWWDYGPDKFGRCSDFTDSYIDVDDDVPGSNRPLPHAFTVDVTQARVKNNIKVNPHNWPTLYYQLITRNDIAPRIYDDPSIPEMLKVGESVSVDTWESTLH